MKKFLALILTIALMLSLSVTAFAAEEPTTYDIWVGGVQVTSANKDDITTAITEAGGTADGTATYDPESETLTLNGFSYTGEGYVYDSPWCAAIFAKNDLTVKVVGSNTVTASVTGSYTAEALNVWGGLTITGDSGSSLTLTGAGRDGVGCGGNLKIENVTVNATGTSGLYSDEGNITINNAEVTATATTNQMQYAAAIYAYEGNITIENSTVTANAPNANAVYSYYSDLRYTIKNSNVTISASKMGIGLTTYTQLFVDNSTVEVTSDAELAIVNIQNNFGAVPRFTGTHVVYAGDDAGSATEADASADATYANKYVKIEPAEPVAETKSTTITYQVDPTFTVTIPATVALGETATIKAENVVVAKGKQVEVALTNANDFKVTTPQGASLTYTVKNGETTVNEGDTVLTVNPDNGKTGETTLTFSNPTETAKFAGDYTGSITFTVAVKDAPVTIINFTMDSSDFEEWIPGLTTNLQAEEGMTWAEWIESDYNVDGYVMSEYYDGSDYVYPAGEDWVAVRNTQIDGFGGIVLSTDEIIADNTYTLIQILG